MVVRLCFAGWSWDRKLRWEFDRAENGLAYEYSYLFLPLSTTFRLQLPTAAPSPAVEMSPSSCMSSY